MDNPLRELLEDDRPSYLSEGHTVRLLRHLNTRAPILFITAMEIAELRRLGLISDQSLALTAVGYEVAGLEQRML